MGDEELSLLALLLLGILGMGVIAATGYSEVRRGTSSSDRLNTLRQSIVRSRVLLSLMSVGMAAVYAIDAVRSEDYGTLAAMSVFGVGAVLLTWLAPGLSRRMTREFSWVYGISCDSGDWRTGREPTETVV
ncbi:MAG: hypothetical protein PF636_12355 [Actinomycetota bacterium]|nr:hypothetical protein [Actinomycetota bacterium]